MALGWNAPAFRAVARQTALDHASNAHVRQPVAGRSARAAAIPFMGMLGDMFPEAQFVITGVLGPDANAHGPNEYLDVPTARKVTQILAHVLHAHATR